VGGWVGLCVCVCVCVCVCWCVGVFVGGCVVSALILIASLSSSSNFKPCKWPAPAHLARALRSKLHTTPRVPNLVSVSVSVLCFFGFSFSFFFFLPFFHCLLEAVLILLTTTSSQRFINTKHIHTLTCRIIYLIILIIYFRNSLVRVCPITWHAFDNPFRRCLLQLLVLFFPPFCFSMLGPVRGVVSLSTRLFVGKP
jgi:hypothetical protein